VSALDRILAELASIRDRLQEEVAAAERIDLMERQDELRREARHEAPAPREDLQRQLTRLVAAWDRLQRQRIDVVKQAGDLAAGNFGFTSDAVRINRQIDAAAGREDLESRIRELKAKLQQFDEESS
jgi:hypothetical protein